MKKITICILAICTLLCCSVYAANDYTIIDMAEFENVSIYSEGLCAAQDSNTKRWGFVDTNKNWVIPPRFKSASYFKNDVCAVNTIDGESVLINRNGDVIFKLHEYNSGLESDDFFLEKHGKYKIIWEDMGKMVTRYWITLVDDNYKPITPDNVKLRTFIRKNDISPDGSNTLFWEDSQEKVYNYKGIDITAKLTSENIKLSDDMTVNNKYIIGQADNKIKCFDIDGNKVAEFDYDKSSKIYLKDDVVICNNNVYSIPNNNQIFDKKDIAVEAIRTYYNKFFTVKKQNGTSALYSINGKQLVDFGNWDNIYPSSVSNKIVVVASNKGGIADYDGNILLPLEYGKHPLQKGLLTEDGKYTTLTKDGKTFYTFDLSTLKQYTSFSEGFDVGYKYHRKGDCILDNNLNEVYCHTVEKSGYEGNIDFLAKEGIMRLYYQLPTRSYGFLMFEDSGVKVKVDDTLLNFDVLPVIQNGRTLVPMRAIFEALGASVEWNGETQSITAKNKDVTIQMQIGNNTLTKNGQSSQIDVSPQLIDGRTMVPVRAISDCFNVLVDWNGYTQTVSLFTN